MSASNLELVRHILTETAFIIQNKIPDLDHFLNQLV
jgi:hypothetical protein